VAEAADAGGEAKRVNAVSITESLGESVGLPDGYPVRLRAGEWADVGDEVAILTHRGLGPPSGERAVVVSSRRSGLDTFTVLTLSNGAAVPAHEVKLVEPYQPGDWMRA
jgi:hypothetical protein